MKPSSPYFCVGAWLQKYEVERPLLNALALPFLNFIDRSGFETIASSDIAGSL